MEQETLKPTGEKPVKGTWDSLPTAADLNAERKPKVDFDFNKSEIVSFAPDFVQPRELPSPSDRESVFYIFDVKHDGQDKVIMTSAWSLLKELKAHNPLAGKTLKITKVMDQNKQQYKVELVDGDGTQVQPSNPSAQAASQPQPVAAPAQ